MFRFMDQSYSNSVLFHESLQRNIRHFPHSYHNREKFRVIVHKLNKSDTFVLL